MTERDKLTYDFLIEAVIASRGSEEGLLAVTSSQKGAVEKVARDLFKVVADKFPEAPPDFSCLGSNHFFIGTEKYGIRVVQYNPNAFTIGFAVVSVVCRPDGVD